MVKKTLFVGGAVVLLLGLLFGREAASYVATSWGWMHDSVKQNVPIEFELARARKMIENLDPEIRHNMTLIAREEVAVQRLAEHIQETDGQLAEAKSKIMQLNNDLQSGSEHFVYAERSYTVKQVRDDLERRFNRFRTKEEATNHLRQVLDARRAALNAAQEKLENMMAAKSQLQVDVEQLEARLKMVEVAQAKSSFHFDESHLSRTKELLSDIQARIDVASKLVNAEDYYQEEIPVGDDEKASDISAEITKYFEGAAEETSAYAAK